MLKFNRGDDCNFSGKSAKGEFTLYGDKDKKLEKAYTILNFPGGCFELSRTSDNQYWAHITVKRDGAALYTPGDVTGTITDARIDASGRYLEQTVKDEIAKGDFAHIAIRIKPA